MNNLIIKLEGNSAKSNINGVEYVTDYSNREANINGHKMRWIIENNKDVFNAKGQLIGDSNKIVRPNIIIDDSS